MALTVAPGEVTIDGALRSFLTSFLASSVAVVRGQDNRVAEPNGVDFVVVTATRRDRIETNVSTYDPVGLTQTITQPTEIMFQLDVHGPNSADNAELIATLFRDEYAVEFFAGLSTTSGSVYPLHADNPRQVPFINDQQQFETRWIVEALLQANQAIIIPQQSATVLTVNLNEVL